MAPNQKLCMDVWNEMNAEKIIAANAPLRSRKAKKPLLTQLYNSIGSGRARTRPKLKNNSKLEAVTARPPALYPHVSST